MGNKCLNNSQNNKQLQFNLNVKIYTDIEHGDDLYGYKTRQTDKFLKEINLTHNCILLKLKQTILFIKNKQEYDLINGQYIDNMFDIQFLQNNVSIGLEKLKSLMPFYSVSSHAWRNIKNKTKLAMNDYIKLGKSIIKFLDIVTDVQGQNQFYYNFNNSKNNLKIQRQEALCKICYQTSTNQNPLLNPCKCIGSIKYIHKQCLKSCIIKQSKFNGKKNGIIIQKKHLNCKICNSKYFFGNQTSLYNLFLQKYISLPYVILQVIRSPNQQFNAIILQSIQPNKAITIGRLDQCDITLDKFDGLSAVHANLIFDSNELYLKDMNSTFGTCVLIKQKIELNNKHKMVSIQFGNILITLTLETMIDNIQGKKIQNKSNEELIQILQQIDKSRSSKIDDSMGNQNLLI